MIALGCLTGPAAPAALACACGALPDPDDGGYGTTVLQETAVLSRENGIETIVMGIGLSLDAGSEGRPSAGESAPLSIVMPTPSVPEVSAAESATLEEMAIATAPREEVRRTIWGPLLGGDGDGSGGAVGAPSGGPQVTVHEQMRLGDYEVAVLGGTVEGVTQWLADNGYVLPAPVTDRMAPYAAEGWTFTAVRLADDVAAADGADTAGERELQPLRFDFATDELIYPMRLSGAATATQHVHLYVIGAEPVARTDDSAGMQSIDRAWIGDPTEHGHRYDDPVLVELDEQVRANAGGEDPRAVVTALEIVAEPFTITTDFTFAPDPGQEDVIPTITRTEVITVLGLPLGWVLIGAILWVLTIAVIAGSLLVGARASRPRAER